MDSIHVIKKPVITEKVTAATESNQYCFQVDQRASKTEIKKAIEELYGVSVVGITTQIRSDRDRAYKYGKVEGKTWKRAMIRVAEGQKIELF